MLTGNHIFKIDVAIKALPMAKGLEQVSFLAVLYKKEWGHPLFIAADRSLYFSKGLKIGVAQFPP